MEIIITEKILKIRESKRKSHFKNREKNIARMKEYNSLHEEEIKEYAKKYYLENSDKRKENSKNYQKSHLEERRELYRERRARLANTIGGHFTEKEWQELLEKTGRKCLCCGATDKPLCRDHVIPLGSPHSDEISNIQPLCRSCNSRKKDKTIDYRNSCM